MYTPIRWQQRFQNFEKAYLRLTTAIERYQKAKEDELILEGLVQTYEFTYELALNTTKDFLTHSGHSDITGSRSIIKQALQDKMVTDGHAWMDAIEDRNLTSHTYNEELAKQVVAKICSKYFFLIEDLYKFFKNEYDKQDSQ